MLGFYETIAIACFVTAAVMVIVVILREVLAARKEKRQFDAMSWENVDAMSWENVDAMIHNNEVKLLAESRMGYDTSNLVSKDEVEVYDWKKDGL